MCVCAAIKVTYSSSFWRSERIDVAVMVYWLYIIQIGKRKKEEERKKRSRKKKKGEIKKNRVSQTKRSVVDVSLCNCVVVVGYLYA